jgi:membrane-bound serine protease (ClpP class)
MRSSPSFRGCWYAACILCVAAGNLGAATLPPRVVAVRLRNEAITPITSRFVARTLRMAAEEQAECVVLIVDTPGGLVDSTRELVKEILSSPVPVIVYVAPPGARAASAGVFVTMAAHVAAMAPGTTIGAAHPVPLGGLPVTAPPQDEEWPKDGSAAAGRRGETPEMEKAVNDTVAWARALAERRGRNAGWVERAVRESVAVPAGEAVAEGAVDLLADDLPDLLAQLDGREIELPSGQRPLRTAGAKVDEVAMWWGEKMLAVLANPNLAILLLMLGFYGVVFEFYSPGWGVAGTLGAICLALSFFSLAVLPVRFAGLLLVLLALTMFVAEVFVTSYGALSLGGAACLVLGGLMLVESPAGFIGVSLNVLVPFALATAVITIVLVASIVRTHRRRILTGDEAQIGSVGVADVDFQPTTGGYAGSVLIHGERWQATSAEPVAVGTSLEVLGRDGLTLRIRPTLPPPEPNLSTPTPGDHHPCHPV